MVCASLPLATESVSQLCLTTAVVEASDTLTNRLNTGKGPGSLVLKLWGWSRFFSIIQVLKAMRKKSTDNFLKSFYVPDTV